MVSKDSSGMATVQLQYSVSAHYIYREMYKPIIIIAHWSIVRNIIIGCYVVAHKEVYLMECLLIILPAKKSRLELPT